MLRPRRSTTSKIYATHSIDEEMEAQIEGSNFDSLSEGSALSDESDGGISESEGSDTTSTESSPKIPDCLPLFPNILTEPQMIHNRALVIEQTTNLARLKAGYEEHIVGAQALELKINEAEETLFENKAKLSTLNRIPLEILGVIFTSHVQDNGQSPWLLMQISRVCRATALLTRVLWRGIMLVPRIESLLDLTSEPAAIRRTRDGMEICSSEALVRSALKRAGSCPLDLKIAVSGFLHGTAPKRQEAELLRLVQLMQIQNKPRVRSLEVFTAGQFTFPIDTFDQFSFAEVESVIFDGNYPPVLRMLKDEAPLLHKLHIMSTSLDFLQDFGRWDQINELSVTRSKEAVDVDIKFALEDAANLTSLQLVGELLGPLNHNNHDTPELPTLSRLHFQKTSNIFSFKYPNVTHLTIQYLPNWTGPPPPEKSVILPHLVEVLCTGWVGCIGILSAIHAPSLQTLKLEGSTSKAANARGFKNLWPTQSVFAREKSPPGLLPVALHMKHVWIPVKAWGRIFAEQTTLEECHIENGDVTAAFFEALTPVKSARSNGSKGRGKSGPNSAGWKVDCPMLKKMVLDCRSFVLPNQKTKESAQAFIARRVEAGVPLERFAIRLSRDTEWEELVV